jgi:hypothetical protein
MNSATRIIFKRVTILVVVTLAFASVIDWTLKSL